MNRKKTVRFTGGCIKCAKCESVRQWNYCGHTKLTDKQLYDTKGCCSKFVPKADIKEMEQNNLTDHIMQRFMRKE